MKKLLPLVLIAVVAYFFFQYLGEESDSPSYLLVKLDFATDTGRPIAVTAIEKLAPGFSCSESLTTRFTERLRDACGDCRIDTRSCSDHLSNAHRKAFDLRVLDVPYFAYEKGGLMPQQDFRLLFHGLDPAEAGGACVEMRKLIKNDILFFLGGSTECVRPSIMQ